MSNFIDVLTRENRQNIKRFRMLFIGAILLFFICNFGLVSAVAAGEWLGSGTQDSPYLISSADDLVLLAERVNSYELESRGKYFLVTNDIDLSGVDWTPIGTYLINHDDFGPDIMTMVPFNGFFDGGGHTISGFRISSESICGGLFGIITDGYLKNIRIELEDAHIDLEHTEKYGNSLGGLVGYISVDNTCMSGILIENCDVSGVLRLSNVSTCGGLIGNIYISYPSSGKTFIINDCSFVGNIVMSTGSSCGGLIGHLTLYDNQWARMKITNCYVDGGITATGCVGGIIGSSQIVHSGIDIYNCSSSSGHILSMYSSAGGLIGSGSGSSSGYSTIDNCWSTSSITGYTAVGGLIGEYSTRSGDHGNTLRITNSYSTGLLHGKINSNYELYAGGLIGKLRLGYGDETVYIKDCYSSSSLITEENENHDKTQLGGLVGIIEGPSTPNYIEPVQNSVALNPSITSANQVYPIGNTYDSENECTISFLNSYALSTLDVVSWSDVSKVDPETAETRTFYEDTLGWDFENVWTFDKSISKYPVLQTQIGGIGEDDDDDGESGTENTITFSYSSTIRSKDINGNDITIDREWTVPYSDSFFSAPSTEYNHDLAKLALSMAVAAFSSSDLDNRYSDYVHDSAPNSRYKNIAEIYELVGCKDTVEYYDYDVPLSDASHKVAFSIAEKDVKINGEDTTIVFVIIRGGNYGAEWSSDFVIGKEGEYGEAFGKAAEKVLTDLSLYLNKMDYENTVKIFITGFSRGAAVANIVSGELDQLAYKNIVGTDTDIEDIYAYTFATPQGVNLKQVPNANAEMYSNIFNIVNPSDLVPEVIMDFWEYGRYGNTLTFDIGGNTAMDAAAAERYYEIANGEDTYDPVNFADGIDKFTNELSVVFATQDNYAETSEDYVATLLHLVFYTNGNEDKGLLENLNRNLELIYGSQKVKEAREYAKTVDLKAASYHVRSNLQIVLERDIFWNFLRDMSGESTKEGQIKYAADYIAGKVDEDEGVTTNIARYVVESVLEYPEMLTFNHLGHYWDTLSSTFSPDEIVSTLSKVDTKKPTVSSDLQLYLTVGGVVLKDGGLLVGNTLILEGILEDSLEMIIAIGYLNGHTADESLEQIDSVVRLLRLAILPGNPDWGKIKQQHYPELYMAWLNAESNPDKLYTETISSDTVQPIEIVTVFIEREGHGKIFGGGGYKKGTQVSLTAVPDDGYLFSGWYDKGTLVSNSESYTFTANSGIELTAKFVLRGKYLIYQDYAYNTIDTVQFDNRGTYVTIPNAPARDGYTFGGWIDNEGHRYAAGQKALFTKDTVLVAYFWTENTPETVPENPTVLHAEIIDGTVKSNDLTAGSVVTFKVETSKSVQNLALLDYDGYVVNIWDAAGYSTADETKKIWIAQQIVNTIGDNRQLIFSAVDDTNQLVGDSVSITFNCIENPWKLGTLTITNDPEQSIIANTAYNLTWNHEGVEPEKYILTTYLNENESATQTYRHDYFATIGTYYEIPASAFPTKGEYTIYLTSVKPGYQANNDSLTLSVGNRTNEQDISYTITIDTVGSGTATASEKSAMAGISINLTSIPDIGYIFKEWQVIDGNITIVNNTFIMPASNVSIIAVFEQQEIVSTIPDTIRLKAGWNFISVPRYLDASCDTAEELLGHLNSNGYSFLGYNAETKSWYTLARDTAIEPLDAYWVYTTESAVLTLTYSTDVTKLPPEKPLYKGWNAVGTCAETSISAKSAFAYINWQRYLPWDIDNGKWGSIIVNGGSAANSEERLLTLGNGGWLYVETEGTYLGNTV